MTSRGPAVVLPSITNDAVRRTEDTNATLLTVMPAPALTVAPLTNPLPSIVTGTVPPEVPWLGVTALTVTTALETGSAHVCTPVTSLSRMPSTALPEPNPRPPP